MGQRKPYRTDLTDEQWALIEPVLVRWREERFFITVATTPLREIVNAIMYQNRTGCQWDLLPHDFPPPSTVYDYFSAWRDDGTDEKIHTLLRARVRRDAGRDPEPTAMCIDSQTVDTSFTALASTVGYDGNKRRAGRRRHTAVDTMGLVLELEVLPANIHDLRGGKRLIDVVADKYPSVVKGWVDQAYLGLPAYARNKGIDIELTKKVAGISRFTPLPQRWKSERTFGWFGRSRRLVQDYETRPESSRSQVLWTMNGLMMRRITGSTPRTRYRTGTTALASAAP